MARFEYYVENENSMYCDALRNHVKQAIVDYIYLFWACENSFRYISFWHDNSNFGRKTFQVQDVI